MEYKGFTYTPTPKTAWDNLSMLEKSEMMKVAVRNGITDLKTIRQKYNEFAEGGSTDDDLVDWIIREEGFLASPQDIGDGKMTLGSGLTAQKWHDQYKRNGNKWTSSDNRRAVREEVANRRRWAEKNIPNWDSLPSSSQKALLSYKYNYDFNRANSPKLFKALADSNLQEAARQMDATSSNPAFKKGLQDRRQREQEWFLSDVTSKPVVASTIPFEQPVSTIVVNPYVPQVENTRIAPIMVPDEDSYVTAHRLTEAEEKRQKFQERMKAISNFNRLLQMTSLDNTAIPTFMPTTGNIFLDSMMGLTKAEGGGIHIAPSKRGTFTAAATKHGMGVQEFASKVLANKDNYSPAMVRKANFVRNASHWKHGLGGNLFSGEEEGSQKMQIGLKATNGWKPYTLDDILANAARIEQQKQAMEDRLNNVFTLSNDATSVANGRPQNRHLERKAIEGAKAHAAWEKEHPAASQWSNVLGAVPFAVAATPLLAAAGEAAAPVLTNPYVDVALTSGFGAHGLNHAINEGINGWGDAAMTTLEVTPLGRFAVPITSKIMGNIADQSMNILRGDSPVEFVGTLYNYARRKPISFAEKQAAANRMKTFIHSPEYIQTQKKAGLSDLEIASFQDMVARRLNGGNFPAYTMKRKSNGLSLVLPKPFGGIYMREGIPADDFLNAFDHEVAHYSTVNFGKSDNGFIKWLNRENPSVMETVMNYNVNSVPYRPESDVSKIRTARGLSPTTKNLNYYRNEQELRSNAYSMLQEAQRRGITVDDLVDQYTMQSTGEIFGFAPAPLRYLNYAYTPENIKKFTKGFLSFATPLTLGTIFINQDD